MPPSLWKWLLEEALAWFILDTVDGMDTAERFGGLDSRGAGRYPRRRRQRGQSTTLSRVDMGNSRLKWLTSSSVNAKEPERLMLAFSHVY
jgi:hypothetical protein